MVEDATADAIKTLKTALTGDYAIAEDNLKAYQTAEDRSCHRNGG